MTERRLTSLQYAAKRLEAYLAAVERNSFGVIDQNADGSTLFAQDLRQVLDARRGRKAT